MLVPLLLEGVSLLQWQVAGLIQWYQPRLLLLRLLLQALSRGERRPRLSQCSINAARGKAARWSAGVAEDAPWGTCLWPTSTSDDIPHTRAGFGLKGSHEQQCSTGGKLTTPGSRDSTNLKNSNSLNEDR